MKSRCWRSCIPLEALWENLFPSFPASRGYLYTLDLRSFFHLQICFFLLSLFHLCSGHHISHLTLLPPFYHHNYTGSIHPNNPGQSFNLRLLNRIKSAKSLLPPKITYRFWRLGHRHLGGGIIQSTIQGKANRKKKFASFTPWGN